MCNIYMIYIYITCYIFIYIHVYIYIYTYVHVYIYICTLKEDYIPSHVTSPKCLKTKIKIYPLGMNTTTADFPHHQLSRKDFV